MDDPDLTRMAVSIDPDQTVAHVITLVVTTTMNSFEENTQVVLTPHTPRIHAMGILQDAIEQLKDAAYISYDEDDPDEEE